MIRNCIMGALFALLAVSFGCAGEVAPQEDVGASADELMIGGFSGTPSCPGGATPRCVSCGSGAKCYTACTGDFTCDIEEEKNPDGSGFRQCSSRLNACISSAPAPSFGSWGMIAF